MRVSAEAAALEQERVRVEVLRAPLFTCCGEIGILRVWAGPGAGGVAARDRGGEQCEAGKSDWIHARTTGGRAPASRNRISVTIQALLAPPPSNGWAQS